MAEILFSVEQNDSLLSGRNSRGNRIKVKNVTYFALMCTKVWILSDLDPAPDPELWLVGDIHTLFQ